QAPLALLQARRITGQTLTGNPPRTPIRRLAGRRIGFISGGKQLKTADAIRIVGQGKITRE
ncbi:MAG TPA: hypothetical protein VFP38_11095, partial [Bradyrhizobium sp.]|nr:hypothetical protein [Bradyrhizobium sp.]